VKRLFGVVVLVAAGLLAWFVRNRIIDAVDRALDRLDALADGDHADVAEPSGRLGPYTYGPAEVTINGVRVNDFVRTVELAAADLADTEGVPWGRWDVYPPADEAHHPHLRAVD